MLKRNLLILLSLGLIIWPVHSFAQNQTNQNSVDYRLSQALSNSQLNIDEDAKLKISSNCKNAQIIIREIQLQAEKAIKQRNETYNNIQADLQSIKLRMIKQGSDASETDLLSGKIEQKMEQFNEDASRYVTTLKDVVSIDCAQKPELFMAGLILARTERAELYIQATDLKALINNSESSIFYQLKKRLVI